MTLSRLLPVTLVVTTITLLAGGAVAYAQDVPVDVTPIGPDATTNSLFNLDPFIVTAILGTLLPLLVGLITKCSTSPKIKAILLALFSAIGGVITVSTTDGGGAVISQSTVKAAVLTFIAAVAMHFGFLKPTTITATVQAVGPKDDS